MSETLLLLPGLLCDQTVWRDQVEYFSSRYRVIVADYGDADDIAEMARRALAPAPERFSLAGHSLGARVAIEIVRLAGDRVERLALLDTGVHNPKPDERAKRMALVAIAKEQGMNALCDAWLPPMLHPARRGDEAFLSPLRAMVARFSPERFERQIHALLNRPDASTGVAIVDCPLLIGVGRQDSWSPPAQHEEIRRIAGHGDLSIFEDCGHMAPCEAPDAVSAALGAWLGAARQAHRKRE